MTIQTLGKAALESRLIDLLRVHCVIDEALSGLDRNEFKNFSRLNRSHGDLIVKENCARRFGRDIRELKTRFREHENLRIDVEVKLLQQTAKIAPSVGCIFEIRITVFDSFRKKRYRIIEVRRLR